MALRNLTDGKRVSGSLKAFEDLQREAEAILARYQQASSEQERESDAGRGDASNGAAHDPTPAQGPADFGKRQAAQHRASMNVQTPPGKEAEDAKRGKDDAQPEDATRESLPAKNGAASAQPDGESAEQESELDKFTSSLEALRASLRAGRTPDTDISVEEADSPAADTPVDDAAAEANDIPPLPDVEDGAPADEADNETESEDDGESGSVLEQMPAPTPDASPTPLPQRYQDQSNGRARRKRANNASGENGSPGAFKEALQAVRNSVSGLKPDTGEGTTTAPTPKPKKRRRPLSDGIPKSVSEDLPKFEGKPRTRICNRCGHETRLRNPRCGKCGRVDESLGILDSVIAGDIAKVEQILLVRPHLITVRTSRHEWTLLHMAASGGNRKMVELLIEKGASVNATNRDGKTPLHYAAGKGHLNIVKTLLEHHADPHARYHDKTAADLAREHSQHEIAEYLGKFKPDDE